MLIRYYITTFTTLIHEYIDTFIPKKLEYIQTNLGLEKTKTGWNDRDFVLADVVAYNNVSGCFPSRDSLLLFGH